VEYSGKMLALLLWGLLRPMGFMPGRRAQTAFFSLLASTACLLLASSATAQKPSSAGGAGISSGYYLGTPGGVNPAYCNGAMECLGPAIDQVQAELFLLDLSTMQAQKRHQQQEQPSEGVSKLDLKAPSKARKEYEKGTSLLLSKNAYCAVEHLSKAIAIYPKFVAAHNSLGGAYMDLGNLDKAREHFEQATLLDDHLPNSFSNLCHAELGLKHYSAAEQAIKRASSLAPLNLDLLPTLVYAEVMNRDYQDAIATTHKVHQGKHEGAAMVHFFAAAAWREQKNLPEMESELKTFVAEDPKNPSAEKARRLIAQIDDIRAHPPVVKLVQVIQGSDEITAAQQKEQKQIAEAEKMPEEEFSQPGALAPTGSSDRPEDKPVQRGSTGWALRKNVDEVALLFSATDHGKSVSDLTQEQVGIRDDHRPPAAISDFRNEADLPLRLGLVVDTSESITDRFSFEQGAAAGFLQKVLTKDDLAFVVGFSNSVLMVQDFTPDQAQLTRAIGKLAPAGGTALWDAVAYASDKLATRVEFKPVAKMLVVITDGNDNSSQTSLKQAIQAAVNGQVIVYTVNTAESVDNQYNPVARDWTVSVGSSALRLLAERSGGSAFVPGSVAALKRTLAELQDVIRSRYLISYKPADFQADGRYRAIDISAQKSGHKLRVYARKGYYARADAPEKDSSAKTP
jgi:VWFA-related protein